MGYGKKILARFVLVVALVTGVSFLRDGNAKAQGATFENIDPPDEKGPFNVGFMTFDLVPASAGPLTSIQVFYPAQGQLNSNTDCPNTYTISIFGGTYQRSSPLCAVQNASAAPGPFPLIVHDHGGGGPGADHQRINELPVHETLASHGFFVVAIRHSGISAPPAAPGARRVRDIPFVIDFMLDDDNPLSASIDPARIGISGVSTGGRTSLAVTGGWASQGIAADPRIKAMVLYEPGRDNSLDDVATISIPYLVMGGNRSANAVVTVPEVFDTTVLATPRIRVLHPEALHISYVTDWCSSTEETREASLPMQQVEPLTNMITLPSGFRACNTGQLGPGGPPPLVGAAAIQACTFWNQGEIVIPLLGGPIPAFAFGGSRNFCNHVGVNSIVPLDLNPVDGFTDAFVPGTNIELFEGNDEFNSDEFTTELPMPGEMLVPMIKLYTVAFWKKFLEGDGRYMRYLTPGYANTQGLEAEVEIRE